MVVDLAIECDDEPAAFGKHRLPARIREIDNSEPAMPERDPGVAIPPEPFAIGAAMAQARRHLPDRTQVRGSRSVRRLKYPGDPAHDSNSDACVRRRGARRAEDQANGQREPDDWMTQDKMAYAENGERSHQCGQGIELRS